MGVLGIVALLPIMAFVKLSGALGIDLTSALKKAMTLLYSQESAVDASMSIRGQLLSAAMNGFWSNPLIGIGLGAREYWGQGYGTDAMQTLLRYAFTEMNLRRLTLLVFDYNPRAIRSYEKCGFVKEGTVRGVLQREGQRWDWHYMGILKEEWESLNDN